MSPIPIDVEPPPHPVSTVEVGKSSASISVPNSQFQALFNKLPPLPTFSGVIPVQKGEGSIQTIYVSVKGI